MPRSLMRVPFLLRKSAVSCGFFLQAAAHRSPARQGFPRFAANEDETFDAAFAAHDGVAVCFGQIGVQRGEFGEAQAGRVEEFKDGVVAQFERIAVFRRRKQGGDLFGGKDFRQWAFAFARQFEVGAGVVSEAALAVQPAVVAAQGGAVLVQGRGAVLVLFGEAEEVVFQGLCVQRAQVFFRKGGGKLQQQAAVGGNGLHGGGTYYRSKECRIEKE